VPWLQHREGDYLEYIICNDIPGVTCLNLNATVRVETKGDVKNYTYDVLRTTTTDPEPTSSVVNSDCPLRFSSLLDAGPE